MFYLNVFFHLTVEVHSLSCITQCDSWVWPSEKLPFDCQKIAKNLTFFQKNCQKFSFFSKKLTMAIFLEKWKFFKIFWQLNGNFRRVSWPLQAKSFDPIWANSGQQQKFVSTSGLLGRFAVHLKLSNRGWQLHEFVFLKEACCN